jgi:hypothetical protein
VAQVIAYVYGLNAVSENGQKVAKPKPKVPDDLIFDESGRRRDSLAEAN